MSGKRRAVLIWTGYFLLLLWAALPHGMDTVLVPFTTCDYGEAPNPPCLPDPVKPLSTNAELIRLYYTADAAFIAKRAKEIVDTHDWGHVSLWPLWPPGMVAVEAVLYRISPALPVALILVLLTCGIWAAAFAEAAGILLRGGVHAAAALLLPLLLVLTGEFSYFLHTGMFYTESLSSAFFLLGIGCLLAAVPARRVGKAAFAGALIALSAYMRAQTDMAMSVAAGLFILCFLWNMVRRRAGVAAIFSACPWLAVLATALLSYQVVTMPYRAAHGMQWIGVSESPIWRSVWQRPEEMPPVLQFMVDGGVLAGCVIDPALCESIHAKRKAEGEGAFTFQDYQRFTMQTALHHPVEWLTFKLSYLRDFWLHDMPESALLTLLLPLMLVLYPLRGGETHQLLALILLAASIGIVGPLLLAHIEPRYLYQLRLLVLYAALIAPGFASRRPADNANSPLPLGK
jgi:uncharacterized protein YceK